MNEKLVDQSCTDFSRLLASHAPVPGGGGAAALVGALGVALCCMAGNLAIGRKKVADAETRIKALLQKYQTLQNRLIDLVDEDAALFEPLSRAYGISKSNPNREAILEKATLAACSPPMGIMETSCQAIDLLESMLDVSSPALISDVGCGALLCKGALESASFNVFVNTRSLKDRKQAAQLNDQADKLLSRYLKKADQISAIVLTRLRSDTPA